MLTKEGCASRRRRLWEKVPADVQWLLIADPRHVHYLSNFWVHPLSFSAGERGLLLLERENGATLLYDNLTSGSRANEPHVDRDVVETWYDHRHSAGNRDHALIGALKQVTKSLPGRPGLVETEALPVAAWDVLPVRDIRNPPSAPNAVSLGTEIRCCGGKRSRTRSLFCGNACGPPTPAMRGPGTCCGPEFRKWTSTAKC